MKSKFLLLSTMAAAGLFSAVDASAQLLAYDSFSYPAGSLVGQNGGTGFGGAYTASNSGSTVSTPGYTYTDSNGQTLQTAGGKADIVGGNNGVFRSLSATLGGGNTTYYVSFLEQLSVPNDYGGLSLFTGTGSEHLFMGVTGGSAATATAGINLESQGPTTGTGEALSTTLNLLVYEIQFSTSTGVTVSLFDNPTLASQPATANLTQTNATEFTFDTIRIQSGGSDAGAVDEVRIGNTYASVLPVPEPSSWMGCIALLGGFGLLRRRQIAARM